MIQLLCVGVMPETRKEAPDFHQMLLSQTITKEVEGAYRVQTSLSYKFDFFFRTFYEIIISYIF